MSFFIAYGYGYYIFFSEGRLLVLLVNSDRVFLDRLTAFPEQLCIFSGCGRSPMALESNDLLGNMQ